MSFLSTRPSLTAKYSIKGATSVIDLLGDTQTESIYQQLANCFSSMRSKTEHHGFTRG